jgi:putative flippase GtrA
MADNAFLNALLKPTNSLLHQIPRALIVSGFAAALDVGILVLLVELLGWAPVVAGILSYLLGGVLQYVLSSVWVFPNSPKNLVIGFTAFSVLSLVGLAITSGTIYVMYDLLSVHYLIAKGLALMLAFTWNFLSRRYWLFK